jgi:ABC-type sugar transport system permease subunit
MKKSNIIPKDSPSLPLSVPENRLARLSKQAAPYLLILPSSVLMVILILFPLVRGIVMSFTEVDLAARGHMTFVGLEQYKKLPDDPVFWRALVNTFKWTLGVVVFQYLFGLGIALLLNEKIPFRGLFRGLILVPWVVPSVVAALVWRWIYAGKYGILNRMLQQVGLIDEPLRWLSDPRLAMPSVVAVGIWKWVPFMAVVLLAGLQSIPSELYEAAKVDGANIIHRFRYITMPHLRNLSIIATLLSVIWTFNHFDIVYVMTKGGPANATHLISTYSYLTAFSYFDIGYAASMGVVMLVVLMLFAVLYMTRMRAEGQEI